MIADLDGESGENTDEWIAQFVKALEKNNIGWVSGRIRRWESLGGRQHYPPADWEKIVEFAKLPRGTGTEEPEGRLNRRR